MNILTANGVALPAPVSLSVDDEIIWSEDTGRTLDGTMVGDVIAQKKKLSIAWGVLNDEELAVIQRNLIAGFFPITFHDVGQTITISSYRGTLSKEHIGPLGDGYYWYRSASVDLIQQ